MSQLSLYVVTHVALKAESLHNRLDSALATRQVQLLDFARFLCLQIWGTTDPTKSHLSLKKRSCRHQSRHGLIIDEFRISTETVHIRRKSAILVMSFAKRPENILRQRAAQTLLSCESVSPE